MAVRVCCVRGSHYQVGLQIGRAARRQIAEYLDRHHVFANLLGILQTDAGRMLYDGYLRAAKSAYPHYVEEIVGMSEGSGLPFQHLFLMHCQSEMVLMFTDDCKPVTEIEGCTTVFLNVQNGPRVMVHNEDGDSLVKDLGYVVVANIDPYELPNGDIIPAESFTAFCYPGLLAGNAYSFNLHGLCSSGNFQMAKCVEREKIPQRFLCRALLSATSVEQAVGILRTEGVAMASGYSYNLVSTKDRTSNMYSVEVAPAEGVAGNMVSVRAIEPGDGQTDGRYNHYNLYDHLDTPHWRDLSSEHRKARAAVMEPLSTKQDVLKFMGDTEDPEYPVYRSQTRNDVFMTTSTGVFDLEAGVLEVYTDNPSKRKEPDVIFLLPV
ncbi:beta-alanyl-dopamine/carcinine hydrolase-like [Branchiostoma floridae x Branchiostoma japonicum]